MINQRKVAMTTDLTGKWIKLMVKSCPFKDSEIIFKFVPFSCFVSSDLSPNNSVYKGQVDNCFISQNLGEVVEVDNNFISSGIYQYAITFIISSVDNRFCYFEMINHGIAFGYGVTKEFKVTENNKLVFHKEYKSSNLLVEI